MIHMSREKALKILNEPNGPEKLAAKAEQADFSLATSIIRSLTELL